MKYDFDVDIKALVFGAAIAAAFIIFGYLYWEWFYPLSAIGLLYVGYAQNTIKKGTILGAIASIPIVILTLNGYMGTFKEGFFTTPAGVVAVAVLILLLGAFIGLVGSWTKKNRLKAIEEYEQKQKIGKNKKKNKK